MAVSITLCAARKCATAIFALYTLAGSAISPDLEQLAEQRIQYDDDAAKTIVELQPFREVTRFRIQGTDGAAGTATLINLNPRVNRWYLLGLEWAQHSRHASYHLQSTQAGGGWHLVVAGQGRQLDMVSGRDPPCPLWNSTTGGALAGASESRLPYAPLCSGRLYLRNPVKGHQTSLERITDFLRDRVWGGERIIEFVKREFYRDEFLERSSTATGLPPRTPAWLTSGPQAAEVEPDAATHSLEPEHLALDVESQGQGLYPGKWYGVRHLPGVAVSALAPQYISRRILREQQRSVRPLSEAESTALVYLVSFELESLDLHYALGTDHPRLDWSDRPPTISQDARLPGPDGIDTAAPLVTNGMVSPAETGRTVATFVGGFKRSHGAFKNGPLALQNHGSHYGFIEQGVIFSKLQPGLATIFVMDDGVVDMNTWSVADNVRLDHVRYARQNGVPLIEYDPQRGPVPGKEVPLWGPGNWSGSANEDLRTLRAGLCLQQGSGHRYLIYGYFSSATPSAMALVFQAYGCRYAMHLDMNALEHTYLALYVREGKQTLVEHLIDGMKAVDRSVRGELVPRFLAFPDDRDFFYLTRREP